MMCLIPLLNCMQKNKFHCNSVHVTINYAWTIDHFYHKNTKDFKTKYGFTTIIQHPWIHRLAGLSVLPEQQRSRPPRAVERYQNGPPRPLGGYGTGPQSWPRKSAMGTDSPDLAGLEFQHRADSTHRLEVRLRKSRLSWDRLFHFMCILSILSGVKKMPDHQLPLEIKWWCTCIWY